MNLADKIRNFTSEALKELFQFDAPASSILVNQTKPEFEGAYTIVLFSLIKPLKQSPDQLGNALGQTLVSKYPDVFTGFNIIKGFLNLSVADQFLLESVFNEEPDAYSSARMIVEYSSPNTNKPLHLGHLRNNFLGWSVAEILKASGAEVFKTCIVNDRGIHICKSMIAWKLFGNGATPQSTGIKGDHLVGDYYVRCENQIKKEAGELEAKLHDGELNVIDEAQQPQVTKLLELYNAITGTQPKDEEKRTKINADLKEIIRYNTPIMKQARKMLLDWENNDPEVRELWSKMNQWVYEGFNETYKLIGTDFDKTYYESQTYLLGRSFVEEGLKDGVFFRKDDGSTWVDLTSDGLDEKLVLRKDGTSVYITQDMGLAEEKYQDFPYDKSLYVIADEQNYHMKVLQLILSKLKKPYAGGIGHMSYGMVELPEGRMKSREGTVVDADDLVKEMMEQSREKTAEKSNTEEFTEAELQELYHTIALGALKFFLLKVDPKKRIIFDPKESIDFQGFTGPFIQYTYARLKSILRKAEVSPSLPSITVALEKLEKDLLLLLETKDIIIQQAAAEYSPAIIANYAYSVAQLYSSFYSAHKVLKAESEEKLHLRLMICQKTGEVLKHCMSLLGIKVPERM